MTPRDPAALEVDRRRSLLRFAGPLGYALVVLIALARISPLALLDLFTHGAVAGLILGSAAALGIASLPRRLRDSLPVRWRLLGGAVLGQGLLGLAVLLLGLAGLLQRGLWLALLGACWALCLLRLRRTRAGAAANRSAAHAQAPRWEGALWWLTLPFLVLAVLAAAQAPGYLWREEGYGYDVLEYHLQLPREAFEAGRIAYAPHNVYSAFPAQVEMLYLLAMIVKGEAISAGVTAHFIHAILGVLTVAAAWLIGCEFCARAGRVAGVLAGTTGWIVYFCGLAYNENGMLFCGMMAAACLVRAARGRRIERPTSAPAAPCSAAEAAAEARRGESAAPFEWPLLILGGVCAGLACGCKYTAAPLVLLPLAAGALALTHGPTLRRLKAGVVFLLAASIPFSPWLIRNAVWTGNPVFPMANGVFQAYPPGWTADSQSRWDRGHAPAPDERDVAARLSAFGRRVFADADQRFGPVLWLLLLLGLVGAVRVGTARALWLVLLVQGVVWMAATHLYARFAVVLLIPLLPLAALTVHAIERAPLRRVIHLLVVGGAVWNGWFLHRLADREIERFRQPGQAEWIAGGAIPGFEYFKAAEELPDASALLLVGDAKAFYFRRPVRYSVVFNENPLGRIVRHSASEAQVLDRLRQDGVTHLLVNWPEIHRLRASRYGFDPSITPELFTRLEAAGLKRLQSFHLPGDARPYVDLFAVPR